jgi:hypothetical protein
MRFADDATDPAAAAALRVLERRTVAGGASRPRYIAGLAVLGREIALDVIRVAVLADLRLGRLGLCLCKSGEMAMSIF